MSGDEARTEPFTAQWDSLARYEVPEWFRDAKFGIWAHWGPQCEPEAGDWYARHMYFQGDPQYATHLEQYGHPSQVGFKDVIHEWHAEHWNPEELIALYRRAGAQYFFSLANHHDNFDLWDSTHQPWNAVALGPKRNIVAEWAAAARAQGMRFGVSVHASHAWSWYESSQGADAEGPFAGMPYDGTLTKADGAGQWWEGLDPQQLYAQNHAPSEGFTNPTALHRQWEWANGASIPNAAYCDQFLRRTLELIDTFQPDLLYFDDTVLPLYPISEVGLEIAAHYYNTSAPQPGAPPQGVLFGKVLSPEQRKAIVWDIERGASDQIEPLAWQTCTCIGSWHYRREDYEQRRYKSAGTVVHMLADIVSKNGNLLLSVPIRGDGTIDEQERAIVEGIGAWMDIHGEAIFGTRPWKVFGAGPAAENAAPLTAQGFNEGKGRPFSSEDIRYTSKPGVVYAFTLGQPSAPVVLEAFGSAAGLHDTPVTQVSLLGSDEVVRWQQTEAALVIEPASSYPSELTAVYRIQ